MEIMFNDDAVDINKNILNALSQRIEYICFKLDFPYSFIEKIIFASVNDFCNIIYKTDPNEDCIETQDGTTLGKMVHIKQKNKCIILLNIDIYKSLEIIVKNDFSVIYEHYLAYKVLLHEIGHCLNEYKQLSNIIKTENGKIYDGEIPIYYFEHILDEYNANKNILSLIPKEWVLYDLNSHHISSLTEINNEINSIDYYTLTQNIWYFIKRLMDIGTFLLNIDGSEYEKLLNKISLAPKITLVFSSFMKYDKGYISKEELFTNLSKIVDDIRKEYLSKNWGIFKSGNYHQNKSPPVV